MVNSQSRDTTKNMVYKEIRRSIVLGKYQPGKWLKLDELAKVHGTSVTPIREALQMLDQEGLVTTKPHAGFYVTKVTLKELRDMLELRAILEIASIERAAPKITEGQLTQLENIHAGYAGDDDVSRDRYTIENRRFHYLIAQASGNQELAEALGQIHDRLSRFLVFIYNGQEIEDRHQLVIEALRTHDAEKAKQSIISEVNTTQEITMAHVMEKDGAAWYLNTQTD